jgi:hypothetical protein
MAIISYGYGQLPLLALQKKVDLSSDVIKLMLVTSSYVFNQDTHVYKSDVTGEVSSGGGYVTGGSSLSNQTLTYISGSNLVKFDADDITYPSSTISAAGAVIYDDTPALDSAKPLIAYINFGQTFSSSTGDFKVTFSGSGILGYTTV